MKITGQGLLKATSVVFVVGVVAGASVWGLKNDLKPVQSTYGSTPVIEEVAETPIEAPAPVEQVTVVEETPSLKPEPKPEPVDKKTIVMNQVTATATSLKLNPEVQRFCVDKKVIEAGGYDSVDGQKWVELGTTGLVNTAEGQRNFAHWPGMACTPIYFMTRPV